MKPNSRTQRLVLADVETRTSRLATYTVSREDLSELISSGVLRLGRGGKDIRVWDQLLKEDLVIAVASEQPTGLLFGAFRVVGKSIELLPPNGLSNDHPFVVLLEHLGSGRRNSVAWEVLFSEDVLGSPSRQVFQELWEACSRVASSPRPEPFVFHQDGYDISAAQSSADYAYISRVAALHAFGLRNATIALVARERNEYAGGVLVEYSSNIPSTHRAAWRVFRGDYHWLQRHSLCVVRLYSGHPTIKRLHVHEALLRAVIALGPSLVEPPLTIIEGVSYDYHPAAHRLGFNTEIPLRIEHAFYYWKAFSVPAHVDENRNPVAVAKDIHAIVRARASVRYWIARGRVEDIETAQGKTAWAVRRNSETTGRWRCLREGHVVFLVSHDDRLRAYGRVTSTAIRNVRGVEEFPLWIDFDRDMIMNLDIDVGAFFSQPWYRAISKAGLMPLPNEFGAYLKATADSKTIEGKMWVEPNPYLLHRTDFSVVNNQVFVVQSWSLRESVFPVIKDILAKHGYATVYAGDRDGQVIFEDIWLMLNESDLVIVDFTSRRPNVYLEYGMALVLGKPIVAITQSLEDIPSDTPKRILRGARLATIMVKRPSRLCGV